MDGPPELLAAFFLCDDGVYKHEKGVEGGMQEISENLSGMNDIPELSEQGKKDIAYNIEHVHFE